MDCLHTLFADNQDQRIWFTSSHSVGSTTYDGNDLTTIPISLRFWIGHNRIELSDDYVFYSDKYLMYRATENNLQPIYWYLDDIINDFKIYEKMGKLSIMLILSVPDDGKLGNVL